MAIEKSLFFDSVEEDRSYTADQFASYFRQFLTDGIKNGGTNLQVTTATGMNVTVDYGTALIQGYAYWLENDGSGKKTLAVPAAEGQPRIDRVVVRLDLSTAVRTAAVAILKGTAATNPYPPDLTRSSNVYELSLAQIHVPAGAAYISSASIADERYNSNVCGLINSLIELDATTFQQRAEQILDDLANQGYLPIDAETFGGKSADSAKLNGKEASEFADKTHSHSQGDVADLATALAGKSDTNHKHEAGDITSGKLAIARIPTGTTSTTVALGNHTHSGYAPTTHSHSGSQVVISYGLSDPPTLPTGQIYVKIS